MRHRFSLTFLILLGSFVFADCSAYAGKFDLGMGYFSISAKTEKSQGSLANIGSYLAGYRHQIGSKLEVSLGYTVLMSKSVGGELGYGPDFGAYYYPFSRNSSLEMDAFAARLSWSEVWKPFLGVSFSQRQFQSVQASYAGARLTVGTERYIDSSMSALIMAHYGSLSGNAGATATEINIIGGISFAFHYFD